MSADTPLVELIADFRLALRRRGIVLASLTFAPGASSRKVEDTIMTDPRIRDMTMVRPGERARLPSHKPAHSLVAPRWWLGTIMDVDLIGTHEPEPLPHAQVISPAEFRHSRMVKL